MDMQRIKVSCALLGILRVSELKPQYLQKKKKVRRKGKQITQFCLKYDYCLHFGVLSS
jgi:hypothetical protein